MAFTQFSSRSSGLSWPKYLSSSNPYQSLAQLLLHITKCLKGETFKGTQAYKFQIDLKERMIKAPILEILDFNKVFGVVRQNIY